MMYSIIFMLEERILGTTPWDKGFDTAKEHAVAHMPIKGADRVEVRDEDNKLLFHHPRTLKVSQ